MKCKICLIFIILLLFSSSVYSQIASQYPGGPCPYDEKTHTRVQEWLSKSYKNAVQAILNGRDGKRLPQCKIDEIKPNLSRIILEYACEGCDGCGKGLSEHTMVRGTASVIICEPKSQMLQQPADLNNPPTSKEPCGCIEGLMVHEIVHATTGGSEAEAVDCSKILYKCAPDAFGLETKNHVNCCCPKKK